MAIRLSVIDQSIIPDNCSSEAALERTLALAALADELGFHRFWVTEHHAPFGFASCSPDVLIASIAATTKNIRVGAGGVMLCHHSPYRIAGTYNMLASLYPNRIDLGLGRSQAGTDSTAQNMAYSYPAKREDFPTKVSDTVALIHNTNSLSERLTTPTLSTSPKVPPEAWLLGSSPSSAMLAAELGMPYFFAHFIAPQHSAEALTKYRQHFMPSHFCAEPTVGLGIVAYCADTLEKAEALAHCRAVFALAVMKGGLIPWPSIETALAFNLDDNDRAIVENIKRSIIFGTPQTIRQPLLDLAETYGVCELMLLSNCYDFEDQYNSIKSIARAMATDKQIIPTA